MSEGYTLLNNKVDTLGNELHTGIRETRQELIFLIKATVEHAKKRLTREMRLRNKEIFVMNEGVPARWEGFCVK